MVDRWGTRPAVAELWRDAVVPASVEKILLANLMEPQCLALPPELRHHQLECIDRKEGVPPSNADYG